MFGQYVGQYADRYHMMDGGDWGWGWLMMLLWLALVVGIIILVMRLMGTKSQQEGSDPLKIAQERYAKGEISKQEYDQLKKDLGGK